MMRDDEKDYIVDIEILPDIEMAIDTDGLPKTIAKEQPKVAKADPIVEKDEPKVAKPDTSELDMLRRERDEARAEAARAQADANAKIEAERQARLKAEGESGEDRNLAMRAHWAKVNAEAEQINTAISATKQAMETARAAMKSALETGDVDKQMKAQEALADLTIDARELERGKAGAEAEVTRVREAYARMNEGRKEAKKEPDPVKEDPKPDPKPASPDDWIASVRKDIGSGVADWLSENKQFVTDPKLNNKVISFANYFHANEEKPLSSPEFLEALKAKFTPEKATKQETAPVADAQDNDDDEPIVIETEPKRQAAPAAPVSRASAPAKASGPTTRVRLSADQATAAVRMYPDMSPQEARMKYAGNLVRAQNDGKFLPRE